MNDALINKVLEQIVSDVHNADLTAIEELIRFVPVVILEGFLPEINDDDSK